MKARIKKTGAILYVEEITNNAIFLRHPFDPELKSACTPQEVDFIGEEDKVQIDWEQRRYEIAKDVFAAQISDVEYAENNSEQILAKYAVKYADALIKELKGGKQ